MNQNITLPKYNETDYPLTSYLLSLYDTATRWMDEAPFSHRDLFHFACQRAEVKLQNKRLAGKISQRKMQLDELRRELVILKALEREKPRRG